MIFFVGYDSRSVTAGFSLSLICSFSLKIHLGRFPLESYRAALSGREDLFPLRALMGDRFDPHTPVQDLYWNHGTGKPFTVPMSDSAKSSPFTTDSGLSWVFWFE